ncbi:hypothetical protein OG216_37280 [Streptomycetaceae bacterium NBC_01309]
MTVVLLKDWDRALGSWVLTVATGEVAAWPDPEGTGNVGWISLDRHSGAGSGLGGFCAVYADGSDVWFQAGADRWLVDEHVVFVRECDDRRIACRFSLVTDAKTRITWHYTGPLGDPGNQADPTFDGLDEELQDLRLFLARVGNSQDWRHRFVSLRHPDPAD